MSEPPSLVIHAVGDLTEEQVAEIKERWLAIVSGSSRRYRYLYKGRWRRALPLPWHTRLHLWCTSQRDHAAIWLIDHFHWRAGEWLWRGRAR